MFDQAMANQLAQDRELLLICGRYEGVDERVPSTWQTKKISIGNYVLSGGELAAAVVIDSVARLLAGGIGNESSATFESFQESGARAGVLDAPIGPGLRISGDGRRRRFYWTVITKRSADSGRRQRSRKRRGCGRIC